MTEEAEMSTLADDINKQIGAGRKSIERSLDEMKEMEMPKLPPAGLVAAGLVTAVVAVGIVGWLVYRSRRRRTLVRLKSAGETSARSRAGMTWMLVESLCAATSASSFCSTMRASAWRAIPNALVGSRLSHG